MPLTVFGAEKISAKLIQMDGDVQIIRAGGEKPFKAFINMRLTEGDRIITGLSGKAKVQMDDEVIITLAENTRVYLSELRGSNGAKQSSINLQSGGVGSSVKEKLKENSRFEIKTPTAVMGVRGTEFFTQYYSGNVDVRVVDGTVEIRVNVGKDGKVTGSEEEATTTYTFPVEALQQIGFNEGEVAKGIDDKVEGLDLDGLPVPFLDRIKEIKQESPGKIPEEIIKHIDKAVENAIKKLREKMENKNLVPDEIASALEKTIVGNLQETKPTIKPPSPPQPTTISGSSGRDRDDNRGGDSSPSTVAVKSVEISGGVVVGQTLTANVVPEGATVNYQWMRSGNENDSYENIDGATSNSYKLTIDDVGKDIKVKVTGIDNYTGTIESKPIEGPKVGITATMEKHEIEPGYSVDSIVITLFGSSFKEDAGNYEYWDIYWDIKGISEYDVDLIDDKAYISVYCLDEHVEKVTIQAKADAIEEGIDTNVFELKIFELSLEGEDIEIIGGCYEEDGIYKAIKGTEVIVLIEPEDEREIIEFLVDGEDRKEDLIEGDTHLYYTYTFIIEKDTEIEVIYEDSTNEKYSVVFGVVAEEGNEIGGSLSATIDNTNIISGIQVKEGMTIDFCAEPETGYRVKKWLHDSDEVLDNDNNLYVGNLYKVEYLEKDTYIYVEFEEDLSTEGFTLIIEDASDLSLEINLEAEPLVDEESGDIRYEGIEEDTEIIIILTLGPGQTPELKKLPGEEILVPTIDEYVYTFIFEITGDTTIEISILDS